MPLQAVALFIITIAASAAAAFITEVRMCCTAKLIWKSEAAKLLQFV